MERRSPSAGFTLVEVLVAIILSATTVIGIIALYRIQTSASGFSRRATEASVIAEDHLERLRTLPPVGPTGPIVELVDERGVVTAGGFFTRSWTITPGVIAASQLGYVNISVTVTWTDDVARSITVLGRRNQ
jgi:Tfp pilus assembly protein PilV